MSVALCCIERARLVGRVQLFLGVTKWQAKRQIDEPQMIEAGLAVASTPQRT